MIDKYGLSKIEDERLKKACRLMYNDIYARLELLSNGDLSGIPKEKVVNSTVALNRILSAMDFIVDGLNDEKIDELLFGQLFGGLMKFYAQVLVTARKIGDK